MTFWFFYETYELDKLVMQYSKYDVEEYNSSNKNITNKEPGDWKSPFPPFICVYEKFDQLSSVNKQYTVSQMRWRKSCQ